MCGQTTAGSTRCDGYSLAMNALPLGEGSFARLLGPVMMRWLVNGNHGAPGLVVLPAGGFRRAKAEITAWAEYLPTPLVPLPGLAEATSLEAVAIKDESRRLGLGNAEVLGGAYAVGEVVKAELARRGIAPSATTADLLTRRYPVELTVTCASEGNLGTSVAWGARRVGAACRIVVPDGSEASRIRSIEALGASVCRQGATYDDSVQAAAAEAARQGWLVVSDTAWPAYTEVPRMMMQGYRLLVDEALDQWIGAPPTHVVIQAGRGGIAAAVSVHTRVRLGAGTRLLVVGPEAKPNLLAWQELERAAFAHVEIEDATAGEAVRRLSTEGVGSSPSGAAGAAGLFAAASDPAARAALELGRESRVLLFNTERSGT